jgi:hypothetical protein
MRVSCGLSTCTEDKWPRVNLGAAMHLEEPRWSSLRKETAPVSRREKPQGGRSTPAFQDSARPKRKKTSSGEDNKVMIAVLNAHDRHREVARKTEIFPPYGTRKCKRFNGRGAEAGQLQGAKGPLSCLLSLKCTMIGRPQRKARGCRLSLSLQ